MEQFKTFYTMESVIAVDLFNVRTCVVPHVFEEEIINSSI